jgi:small-conductance mechanosensitive channel
MAQQHQGGTPAGPGHHFRQAARHPQMAPNPELVSMLNQLADSHDALAGTNQQLSAAAQQVQQLTQQQDQQSQAHTTLLQRFLQQVATQLGSQGGQPQPQPPGPAPAPTPGQAGQP